MKLLFVLLLCSCCCGAQGTAPHKTIHTTLSAEEWKLYKLIMHYRKEHGLPEIPLSNSLTFVAQTHCADMVNNQSDTGVCNGHSWSDKGSWTPCCYTPDHKQATCMWRKPQELTNYQSSGYEIGYHSWGLGDQAATAEGALDGWKNSHFHNDVILNQDIWKGHVWKAIGVGMLKGRAFVWFGDDIDKEGKPALPKGK